MSTKDSKIRIYSELHQSDAQGYKMEDFKNCMLEFLKKQEKQRQENLKQQEKTTTRILKDSIRALYDKKKDSGNYSNVLQKKTTRKI